jgi:hypothetical protein
LARDWLIEWWAEFGFSVVRHPERGILVAYHVANTERDIVEAKVVSADNAPYNLPSRWTVIGLTHGVWNVSDLDSADETNSAWNAALRAAIESV